MSSTKTTKKSLNNNNNKDTTTSSSSKRKKTKKSDKNNDIDTTNNTTTTISSNIEDVIDELTSKKSTTTKKTPKNKKIKNKLPINHKPQEIEPSLLEEISVDGNTQFSNVSDWSMVLNISSKKNQPIRIIHLKSSINNTIIQYFQRENLEDTIRIVWILNKYNNNESIITQTSSQHSSFILIKEHDYLYITIYFKNIPIVSIDIKKLSNDEDDDIDDNIYSDTQHQHSKLVLCKETRSEIIINYSSTPTTRITNNNSSSTSLFILNSIRLHINVNELLQTLFGLDVFKDKILIK